IWDAMAAVARISQRVSTHVGHTIRIKAVRVERDHTPTRPLQAYIAKDTIVQHCIPWQQVLIFFARTQSVARSSPPPTTVPRPRQATRSIDDADASDTSDASDASDANEDEVDQCGTPTHDTPENRAPFELTAIEASCLDFCMELLNQCVRVEDYECALICALAVQGCGPAGWLNADSYPPILSRVIKVARFLLVHKAIRLDPQAGDILKILRKHRMASTWESDSPMDDEGYVFISTPGPSIPPSQATAIPFSQPRPRRSFQE
ncbi:unnamed protein product, partial [Penicillium salamii]